jgi:hypothetical protein
MPRTTRLKRRLVRRPDPAAASRAALPWRRRYRLLIQLGALASLAAVLVAVVLLFPRTDDGPTAREERAAAELSLARSIDVAPADLPESWGTTGLGFGFWGNLRGGNLGAATALAGSPSGGGQGWAARDPGLRDLDISSGIIVGDDEAQAEAALARLREATPAETAAYVEPTHHEVLDMTVLPTADDRTFAFTLEFRRNTVESRMTVYWRQVGRSLIFAADIRARAAGPIRWAPDLPSWLDDLTVAVEAASAGP